MSLKLARFAVGMACLLAAACLGGVPQARAEEPAQRCQQALDERVLYMYTGQSNLQLTGPDYLYATTWRSRAGVNGHYWFSGSGWQTRTGMLYSLAADVAGRLGAGN